MEPDTYAQKLKDTKTIPDIFEIVKDAVRKIYKSSRPGLMLGLADLGEGAQAWIGGYHILASNAIVMNSRPLDYIEKAHPELYKAYVFVVLLHEYIHTLGIADEEETRGRTYEVCKHLFEDSMVTELASNISKFLPYFREMQYGWQPPTDPYIRYVRGFDRSSVSSYFI